MSFSSLKIALELTRRLGNALVVPTVRPGVSPQHMEFPATISLRPETRRWLIEDYVHSLARYGVGRVVVISSHLGARSPVEVACQALQAEFDDRAVIVPILLGASSKRRVGDFVQRVYCQ